MTVGTIKLAGRWLAIAGALHAGQMKDHFNILHRFGAVGKLAKVRADELGARWHFGRRIERNDPNVGAAVVQHFDKRSTNQAGAPGHQNVFP